MSSVLDEVREEAVMLERVDVAVFLIKMNKLTLEEIADASKLPIEKVRELATEASV